jgi:hypothetical protein
MWQRLGKLFGLGILQHLGYPKHQTILDCPLSTLFGEQVQMTSAAKEAAGVSDIE